MLIFFARHHVGSFGLCNPNPANAAMHEAFVDSVIIASEKYTMTSRARLVNMKNLSLDVIYRGIRGDFVETGVWNGGNSMITRAASLVTMTTACHHNWLFDSFEGLPINTALDKNAEQKLSNIESYRKMDPPGSYSLGTEGVQRVRRNFETVFGDTFKKNTDSTIHFVKGWFVDTVFKAPLKHIAILRLDGDLYSSTMDVLNAFYHKVTPGGYVVIDDYGHWPQCKLAVHDFFDKMLHMDIAAKLNKIDDTGVFFQKPVA